MLSSPSQITRTNIINARTVQGIPPTHYQVPYKNIADLLRRQVDTYRDKPWLIFFPDDPEVRSTYTYQQFYELACKTANFLLSQGVVKGDRIATIAYNHVDTVIQYFASWLIGAVVVPINVGEDDKRIGYILQNSQSKLAFVREEFIERVDKILSETPSVKKIVQVRNSPSTVSKKSPDTLNSSPYPPSLSKRRGSEGVEFGEGKIPDFHTSTHNQQSVIGNLPDVSLEDEALIVYTSGTTGLPKGVVLTQYNLLIDAKAIAEWHQMTPDQRMMCVLPIHHVNGTVVTLMTPMYFGGSVVLNQKFRSDKFFECISTDKVHVVSVVPTLLQFLLHENSDMSAYDLSHFRHIICGAGPLTVELALKFEEHFKIPIIHGYGLSETTCYSCFLPLDLSFSEHQQWLGKYGFPSIGIPISSNEMAIHDDMGNDLREDTKGEIVIRGHNVMKEYFLNPEANDSTFAHGWFRSGDEGFYKIDEKGRKYFFITGRIKELIIRGGVNLSPFEIDEVLMNMPGVRAGVAVGFENDWYGEEVGAYIQSKNGAHLTEQEVINYCRNFFSYAKCPKVVLFGDDVPVTSTGKYQRNKLKPLFEKWKTVQFKQ